MLTKKDLVDDDWLELVGADVREALVGAAFEGAPMIAASAMTGEGLDELKQTIAESFWPKLSLAKTWAVPASPSTAPS